MNSEKTLEVLLVGQTPPPFHGQAIATRRMLEGRYDRLRFFHVPMRFSKRIGDIGKFGAGKLRHLVVVIFSIVRLRFSRRQSILFFPPAGGDRIPMYRDLAILCLTRWLFRKTVFFFHANGLAALYPNMAPGLRTLFRRSYFGADLALVPSESVVEEVGALRPKRCVIIPHGISDHYPHYRSFGKRRNGKAILLFVGIVRASKGVLVLLEACRLLRERGRDFTLRVVGEFDSPSFRDRASSLVRETGLSEHVDWCGPLLGGPKWRSYASADIVCFPSLFETFGQVVLEAMQFALPVVATPVGSTPSMIEDGRSGFLVPLNDSEALAEKLAVLIDHPERGEQMGRLGREIYLKRFTAEQFWRNLEEAFLSIA